MAQRAIALDSNTLIGAERVDLSLVDQRVELDLVNKRHFGRVIDYMTQVRGREVAHSDSESFALFFEAAENPPRRKPLSRVFGGVESLGGVYFGDREV